MTLADWGHRHAKAILFVTVILAIAGAFLATLVPVSLFPRVDYPRIVVSAEAGDMPIEEMVASVTRPLEEAVNSVPGVVNVRSTTSRGAADLSVNFDWHTDMPQAFLLVQSRLDQIRSDLPPDTHLNTRRMDPTVFPVVAYSLTSHSRSPIELRDFAMHTLRPLLGRVAGVASIDVLGGQTPEALVEVNPSKLLAYHLSLSQVAAALQGTNQIAATGRVEQNYRLYQALVDGRYESLEAIASTVVTSIRGLPITVGDLASVRPSTVPQWIRVTANGQDAVLVNVLQQPGGNTVALDDELQRVLAELRPRLPRGVSISQYYDQADLVRESMGSVRDSIVVGILLGAIVLFLFLRHVPITLVAVGSVPLTVALTVILLRAFGQGFNIMTLGGLAAAIGLILDDAIVLVESIHHHLEEGVADLQEATRAALLAQRKPFLGSSLSSIIVFLPMAFLTGVTGAFFKSLSLTMASALAVSLALSLFVIPPIAGRFLRASARAPGRSPGRLAAWHAKALEWLLPRPWWVVILSVLMLGGSVALYRIVPNGFLPAMDEGAFVLDYFTEPGTALSETDRVVRRIEAILGHVPEVESYSRRTGTQLGGALTEPNQGDLLVRLKGSRRRGIDEVIDQVRTEVESSVPGVHVEFAQLMEDLIGDLTAVPQPIEIKIFGSDPGELQHIAEQVAALIPKVPGVVDVFNGITIAGPSLRYRVDPLQAGRFGLTTDALQTNLAAALEGVVPTRMLEGDHLIGIRVRYPEIARNDTAALAQLQLPLAGGQTVSLDRVAQLAITSGDAELSRENLKPMVAVTARIEGQSLGGTISRIKSLLARHVTLPPGVFLEYGGLFHEQQESFKGLAIVMAAAVMLVMTILLFMFRSFAAALAIVWVDALVPVGILGALWLTGTPLNISSMMGMVMVIGIVAENAIFLVHAVHERVREGFAFREALVRGATARARAIFMTTLAAVLALLPLALGVGAGSQMQRPLAIAVIGGFSLSSLLLLFVLPVVYGLLARGREGGSFHLEATARVPAAREA